MRPSTLFSYSINRIQNSLKRLRFKRFLLLALLFSSFFVCITFLVFKIFLPAPINPLQFIVPFVLGVVVSGMLILITRKSVMDLLIDLDVRYECKELLSTAYEYYTSKKESVFSQSLLQEASVRLDSLGDSQLVQRRFLSLYITLSSLTILGIVVLFVAPLLLTQNPFDPKLNRLAITMEEYTNQQAIRILREENKHGSEVFSELRDLAHKIKTQSIEQGNIGNSIAGLKGQVSKEKRQIVDRLNQQLQANKIPMKNPLGEEKFTMQDMQELVENLESIFEDGLPDDLKEQLKELEQYSKTAEFLDQMKDELDELADKLPNVDQRGNKTNDGKHADNSSGEKTEPDKDGDSAQQNDANGPRGNSGGKGDNSPDQLAGQQENEFDKHLKQFSSASRSKSTGKQSDTFDIASSTQQPEFLRSDRGDGDWADIKIRSTTAIGEVKMKQKLIIRDYQKDINSILIKEELPRKHQRTIKNYFLQIGLKGGEEQNGTTE